MNEPRLTIGIPTLNRPELLKRAMESALKQTIPVKIIVADQGGLPETRDVVRSIFDNGEPTPHTVLRVKTSAENIWENWQEAAHWADTEFFAWLQDDDIVSENYAKRIIAAFDAFPQADAWIARLATATAPDRAIWFAPNGPMVPFDLLSGRPALVEGRLFPPITYFTSFAMSPAAAFRRGKAFDTAMARCPAKCDLFTERMILAAMGLQGPIICDPVLAGYWIQHADNESRRQHKDQAEQVKTMCDWADAAMRECPDWREYFELWVAIMPPMHLVSFLSELESPHFAGSEFVPQIREIIGKELIKDAKLIPVPPDSLRAIGKDLMASLAGCLKRLRSTLRWSTPQPADAG